MTALTQLVGAVNNVDSSQIVDGSIVAGDLAAAIKPTNLLGFYQPMYSIACGLTGGVSNTYFPVADGTLNAGLVASAKAPWTPNLSSLDYAVSGLTANMRIRATLLVNGVAPAVNFTFALYPVTSFATAAGQIGIGSIGGAVAAVPINAPGAGTQSSAATEFAMPSGLHTVGIGLSGTMAANSYVSFLIELQGRHV